MSGPPRHFLSLLDCSREQLLALIERAHELREMHHRGERYQPFQGKTLAMLFEKSSTRTRVSFEAGMAQLGGHALFLSPRDTQLGRGEPVADTAKVLSSMADAIMIRTFSHELLETFAENSTVPVINGLSDRLHPCQLLADLQTWASHHGPLEARVAAWVGDGNNVCNSFVNAARLLGFELRIACPEGYAPDPTLLAGCPNVHLVDAPAAAVSGAHLVVTDVWASMGQEEEQRERERAFAGFQVDQALFSLAAGDALFMHCLPAHRGEEVTSEVIDGPRSVVWEEAENRLHAQKALLELLLGAA